MINDDEESAVWFWGGSGECRIGWHTGWGQWCIFCLLLYFIMFDRHGKVLFFIITLM